MDPKEDPPTRNFGLRPEQKRKNKNDEDLEDFRKSESESDSSSEEHHPNVQRQSRGRSLRGIMAYRQRPDKEEDSYTLKKEMWLELAVVVIPAAVEV